MGKTDATVAPIDAVQINGTHATLVSKGAAPNGPHPLTGGWSHPLCGCCDNCCPSGIGFLIFCPCIGPGLGLLTFIPCLFGQIAARASYRPNFFGKHGPAKSNSNNCMHAWLMIFLIIIIQFAYRIIESTWQIPLLFADPVTSGWVSSCSSSFYITFLVFYACYVINFRGFIRNRYNIPGSCCGDCCAMCCCLACALAQMYKHVYAENRACNLCSDPGPHADGNGNGGMVTKTVTTVTTVAVAQPQVVAVAVAQPQPIAVAVAQPQPVAVAVAQPQPVTVVATAL